jgi:hypothetical protein
VLILKKVKVVCFDTLLQVLILNGMEEVSGQGSGIGEKREEKGPPRRALDTPEQSWGKPVRERDAVNTRNGSMRGTIT